MSDKPILSVTAKTSFPDGTSTTVTAEHVVADRRELVALQEIYVAGPAAAVFARGAEKAK